MVKLLGWLIVERWLQARLLLVVLLLILKSVLERIGVLFVLYDAVLGIEWIGDETLTWVHKHYGITYMEGRQSSG